MRNSLSTAITLWTLLHTVLALPMSLLECLENIHGSTSSSLTTPSSSNYNSDRVVYNINFNNTPSAIYHPATEADAAAAIRCAAAHKVPIAPRSGGHSFEGYSQGGQDGSLILDLNNFQQFSIDPTTKIATIGAGTRLGPLYYKLWSAGQYLVPAGTCPTVGIGGHALGGGIGMASRKYGVLTDSIVSMTMIDAEGKTRHVSATSEPDLFWALRGAGGGSFGLVTEFKIQAYKASSKVTTLVYTYPLASYQQVIGGYLRWGDVAPDEVFGMLVVRNSGIELKLNYLASASEALAAVRSLLRQTGEPATAMVRQGDWLQAATQWAGQGHGTLEQPNLNIHRYHRGGSLVYRQHLSMAEMDVLYKYLSAPPAEAQSAYVIVELWGGQIDSDRWPSAAFDHHREVVLGLDFGITWKDPTNQIGTTCKACLKWSAEFRKELYALYPGTLEAYQNYIERDLPDWLEAYYGQGLSRLQQIKKKVDPNNVFSFPQSIPLPPSP